MKRIERRKFIRREDLRRERGKIFLFGDNLEQRGFGGQAREMRGEPNAVGVPTKKRPSLSEDAFFTDREFELNKLAIESALNRIPENATAIVIPEAGLGTGLAQMEKRAPLTFDYLERRLASLERPEERNDDA